MTVHFSVSSLDPSRQILHHHHHHGIPTSITVLLLLATVALPSATAQPPPATTNSDDPYYNQRFSPSTGIIVIVLIAVLFFLGFFSIYVRHCGDSSASASAAHPLALGGAARSRRAQRGLDSAVIEKFPTFNYAVVKTLKIGKGALECAVCLTEFDDDDTLRLIPKCDHVFHPNCIDTWLVGHTTCPVCRCNLVPDDPESGESTAHVTSELSGSTHLTGGVPDQNDVIQEFDDRRDGDCEESESMEQPLHGRTMGRRMSRNRSIMRNLSIGRPRWLGKFARSFSTGHVAVKQWENMERYTLRLPEEVRKQIMTGKLERTRSLVVLPRESSTRRGYRIGSVEGSTRSDRSDRWVFSLAPPFFYRAPSLKSPVVPAAAPPASRHGSLRGSIIAESTLLPV